MKILVTNDDGILSPGLLALARAALDFGEVRVVAPEWEMSASGHAITIARPLRMRPTRLLDLDLPYLEAFRVDGTPADCVALGVYDWGGADLVLSGINLGSNLGHEIWHSGTVAAAKQAFLFGIPAAAFSVPLNGEEPDFSRLVPWVKRVIAALLEGPWPFLVNVNLPHQPKGILWTRQSVRRYEGQVVAAQDPMGRDGYWFAAHPLGEAEEGTDRWAVAQGFVSLTPLRLDLTDEAWISGFAPKRAER
ncbi:5'/3'-nucleotidase SurE [Thermus oshimai]|jgi:5'-nucleotidase|uniref:5'-nucleotidase SurE n=1 Tax=Thermus oshimai JL-2 TaxID=751945 RepID=K7R219_THEOS|nr:5'/3'-nucleotidase SurE [Thermus oshimai]AFV77330.1 5'/3'-nucleotidase SurE [Thermus oshimai JL-2]